MEIFGHSFEPVEDAMVAGTWGAFAGLAALFAGGLGLGLMSLLYLSQWQRARRGRVSPGPGAMAVAEASTDVGPAALSLGMSIAAEGLAIGQTASAGEIKLAVLLVVGFALHNATEGFGIVGPLAAGGVRAPWSYLALAGLLAGGPTFLGTVIGTQFTSEYLSVLFLALAAGAIVYVIGELLNVGRRLGRWDVTLWGVLGGFLVGAATELVIVAAGG